MGYHCSKPPKQRRPLLRKVASLKSNVLLCSRMFIANQQRQGDLAEFFSHENQSYPPSLSDYGRFYIGTKSELLKIFEAVEHIGGEPDCTIEDGGLLLHSIEHFPDLSSSYPRIEVYVDFGSGKDRRFYDIRKICNKLGRRKSRALPVFHSFTGADTTSAFRGKGKKNCLDDVGTLS